MFETTIGTKGPSSYTHETFVPFNILNEMFSNCFQIYISASVIDSKRTASQLNRSYRRSSMVLFLEHALWAAHVVPAAAVGNMWVTLCVAVKG